MEKKDLSRLVESVLEELKNPEHQLSSIVRDFDECGIDYCVIGSLAVRCHNYLRFGDDIDVLVSRDTYPRIDEFLIGNGYSRRQGSDRHLYLELLAGRIPLDIYVEGEARDDGVSLPAPKTTRIKAIGRWYASLPLLTTLKLRSGDLGDVIELIRANELGEEFSDSLAPEVSGKFLELLKELKRSALR
jgi:hypothetical protein